MTANGQRLDDVGEVEIVFHLKGLKISHTFTAVKGLRPNLILGSNFLRDNHVSVNYRDNTVRFYDNMITVFVTYLLLPAPNDLLFRGLI